MARLLYPLLALGLLILAADGCRQLAGYDPASTPELGGPDVGSGGDGSIDVRADGPAGDGGSAGAPIWFLNCQGGGATGGSDAVAAGHAIAVDSAGNSYVAGVLSGLKGQTRLCGAETLTLAGDQDGLLIKIGPDGAPAWSLIGGGPGEDALNAVAIGPGGEIYVAGHFSDKAVVEKLTLSAQGKDAAVIRIDAEGRLLWLRQLAGAGDQKLLGLAATSDGVVAVGWFAGPKVSVTEEDGTLLLSGPANKGLVQTKDALALKLSRSGSVKWLRPLGGPGDDAAEAVSVLDDGQLVVSGYFSSTKLSLGGKTLHNQGKLDAMVVTLAADGTIAGGASLGGADAEEGHGVVGDASGAVVTGWYRSQTIALPPPNEALDGTPAPDDQLFVARYLTQGELGPARGFGSAQQLDGGFGAALLPDNDVVVVGAGGGFSFGSTTLAPGRGIFVGRLSPALEPRAAQVFPTPEGGRAWQVAVDPSGDLILTGYYKGSADFGKVKLGVGGRTDLFVLKMPPPSY